MSETGLKLMDESARAAARLPGLMIEADRVAQTVLHGVHGRRRIGTGESFWQFRAFLPGDSTTQIDWRQSAKSDHLFIRQNEWEAAQSVYLWRDGSASMHYASRPRVLPSKFHRANVLALALAELLLRGGEHIGFLDERRQERGSGLIRARKGLESLALRLDDEGQQASGLPDLSRLPRYAHLVLFSDFLLPVPELAQKLERVAARGLEGHLCQILDPMELALAIRGRVLFRGLEQGEGEELIPRVERVRQDYQQRMQAHCAALRDLARHLGWGYSLHQSDHPPHMALLALYQALTKEGA